jgi:4-amino-4-deoxy-L-arabinose transferase-like glycosyltransferase
MTCKEDISDMPEQASSMKKKPAKTILLLLISIILLATCIRLMNAVSRLPYVYHPDEPLNMKIIRRMFKERTLDPKMLNYPSLYFYINVAAYYPYYYCGKAFGVFSRRADIKRPEILALGVTKSPQPTNVLLGRLVTVIFSIGSVLLVYRIGMEMTEKSAIALLAAFMTAICPTLVLNSGYITPDTFVGFFALLTLLYSIRIFKHGLLNHYILAGVAAGLTISCKYNGAIILIVPAAAHFLRYGLKGFKDYRIYATLGLSIVAFILTTPYAILDFERFKEAVQFERLHYSVTGHPGARSKPFIGYLSYMWRTEGVVTLVALAGIITGFCRRSKETILLSAFPLAYFAFVGQMVTQTNRTLLPMLAFLFLLASIFLVETYEWFNIQQGRYRNALIVGMMITAVAALIMPFVNTVIMTVDATLPDSRENARVWIDENLPAGTKIVIEGYTAFIDPEKFEVKGLDRIVDKKYDWYVKEGYKYLVFSTQMYERYFNEKEKYSERVTAYTDFFSKLQLVKSFDDGHTKVMVYKFPEM